MPDFPKYPAILTKADWDKKKGLIAKTHKTGIGDAMTKCEAAYKKINQLVMEPKLSYSSRAELAAAMAAAAKEHNSNIEPFRKLLHALSALATKEGTEYKKSKLTKGTGDHCDKISKDASNFAVTMKSLDNLLWKPAEKQFEQKVGLVEKNIKDGIARTEAGIKVVEKDPTPKNYSDKCWQALRGLAAAVAQHGDYKDPWAAQFKPLSSTQPNDLKDAEGVKKHLKDIAKLVGDFKKVVK